MDRIPSSTPGDHLVQRCASASRSCHASAMTSVTPSPPTGVGDSVASHPELTERLPIPVNLFGFPNSVDHDDDRHLSDPSPPTGDARARRQADGIVVRCATPHSSSRSCDYVCGRVASSTPSRVSWRTGRHSRVATTFCCHLSFTDAHALRTAVFAACPTSLRISLGFPGSVRGELRLWYRRSSRLGLVVWRASALEGHQWVHLIARSRLTATDVRSQPMTLPRQDGASLPGTPAIGIRAL